MNDTRHNGWKNKETWNTNLMYEAIFTEMAEEQKWENVYHLADAFEALLDELEYDNLNVGSLAKDAVGYYLERVDWVELAERYFVDSISEEDKDKIEQIVNHLNK